MPGDDGYSLIRQIRSAGTSLSSIPAAAVTAHAREEERARALAAGFQMHSPSRSSPARSCAWSTTLRTIGGGQPLAHGCSSRTRCIISEPSCGSVSVVDRILALVNEREISDDPPQVPAAERRQLLGKQIGTLVVHGKRVENRLAIRKEPRAARGAGPSKCGGGTASGSLIWGG